MEKKDSINYEVINNIGVISETSKGWLTELNRVSWNLAEPKYDIRSWSPDHTKMGKGITLTEEELRELGRIIDEEIAYLDNNKQD